MTLGDGTQWGELVVGLGHVEHPSNLGDSNGVLCTAASVEFGAELSGLGILSCHVRTAGNCRTYWPES